MVTALTSCACGCTTEEAEGKFRGAGVADKWRGLSDLCQCATCRQSTGVRVCACVCVSRSYIANPDCSHVDGFVFCYSPPPVEQSTIVAFCGIIQGFEARGICRGGGGKYCPNSTLLRTADGSCCLVAAGFQRWRYANAVIKKHKTIEFHRNEM